VYEIDGIDRLDVATYVCDAASKMKEICAGKVSVVSATLHVVMYADPDEASLSAFPSSALEELTGRAIDLELSVIS
jgi:hypothetical protein